MEPLADTGIAHCISQIETIRWLVFTAIVIAISAWIPWFFHKTSDRKPTGIEAKERVGDRFRCYILMILLTILRKPFLSFNLLVVLGAMIAMFSLLSSEKLFIPGMIVAMIGIWFASLYSNNRKYIFTGLLLLWLALFKSLFFYWHPEIETILLKKLGMDVGLSAQRFSNTVWELPVELETCLTGLDLHKNRSGSIMEGDDFSLRITGWLYVDRSGEYSFELVSDDGSYLIINGNEFLSNPGYHAKTEVADTIKLSKGYHEIQILYFNGTADADLTLTWTPPNTPRQAIPGYHLFRQRPDPVRHHLFLSIRVIHTQWLSILFVALGTVFLFRGLHGKMPPLRSVKESLGNARGSFRSHIPSICAGIVIFFIARLLMMVWCDLPSRGPVSHGLNGYFFSNDQFLDLIGEFDGKNARFHSVTARIFGRNHFYARFEGWLHVSTPGEYQFELRADDGARLFIDHSLFIDAWNDDWRRSRPHPINLQEGFHAIRIDMHNQALPACIDVKWSTGAGIPLKPIPIMRLFKEKPSDTSFASDQTFQLNRRFMIIGLTGILVISLLMLFHPRFSWLDAFLAGPLALSLFIISFLWNARTMDMDHRYGMNWFLELPVAYQFLVSVIILLLAFPGIRLQLKGIPKWISDHPAIESIFWVVAVSFAVMGQMKLTGPVAIRSVQGAVLYGFSGILIILSSRLFPGLRQDVDEGVSRDSFPFRAFLFILIILAATFLRFYKLSELPPGLWWDEAQTGMVARGILRGQLPPIYDLRINAGSLASYWVAGWFAFFGSSVYALRSYCAMVGVVTVLVSYWYFRQFFSQWWSLLGMAFVAISRWLFSINRVAMATIDETILLTFMVFIFYIRAVRSRRMSDYVITGVLLGTGLHLHTGARVLPMIIGADIAVKFFKKRKEYMAAHGIQALIMIILAMVVFAPMAIHIINHQSDYFYRTKQTLLSSEYPGWIPTKPIIENTIHYLKMYSFSGDWHPRHNVNKEPQLAPLIAILAFLGFILALSKLYRDEERLFFMGFCLVSLQGILTVHSDTANLNRVAENIPIVHLWAVVGGVTIFQGLKRMMGDVTARVLIVLISLFILGFTLRREFRIYFHDYYKDPAIVGVYGFQAELTESATYIAKLLEQHPTINIWAEYTQADSFRYVFSGSPRLHEIRLESDLPQSPQPYPIAIIVQKESRELDAWVKEHFPMADAKEVGYSLIPAYTLFTVYFIPPSEELGVFDRSLESGETRTEIDNGAAMSNNDMERGDVTRPEALAEPSESSPPGHHPE